MSDAQTDTPDWIKRAVANGARGLFCEGCQSYVQQINRAKDGRYLCVDCHPGDDP